MIQYISFLGYFTKRYVFLCFPPHVLEVATTLHVALLVSLRLSAVLNPLAEKKNQRKFRYVCIAIIWILSIVYCSIALVFSALKMEASFRYMRILGLHCFGTFPVLSTVIMWGIILNVAKKKREKDLRNSNNSSYLIANKSNSCMSTMVRWLVIVHLFCYVPFLVWKQYLYGVILKRNLKPDFSEKVK